MAGPPAAVDATPSVTPAEASACSGSSARYPDGVRGAPSSTPTGWRTSAMLCSGRLSQPQHVIFLSTRPAGRLSWSRPQGQFIRIPAKPGKTPSDIAVLTDGWLNMGRKQVSSGPPGYGQARVFDAICEKDDALSQWAPEIGVHYRGARLTNSSHRPDSWGVLTCPVQESLILL